MVVIRLLAVSLFLLVLSSCLGATDPNRNVKSYGFILMDTELQDGAYVTDIHGIFFRGQTLVLPSVVPPQDQCSLFPFQEENQVIELPSSTTAGSSIGIRLSGNEFDLTPQVVGGLVRYSPPLFQPVPFQPGDSVHVTIPGSETFPAWSLSGRTAEPFTFEPVDVSPETSPLPLRWTGPTSPDSKMLVSLRYATAAFPEQLAEQIFCELRDDGSFDVPDVAATGWRNAPNDLREVRFARWRLTIDERGNETMLIVSTLVVPTPASETGSE